jgi:hypothetical protein
MEQETAVDYIFRKLDVLCRLTPQTRVTGTSEEWQSLYEQAKAMEKEQIGKAYISGGYAGLHFPFTKDAFDRKYLEDKFTEYHNTNYTNGL